MGYDSPVEVLLNSAMAGVESAWQEIVARYSPLVLTVCYRCGVGGFDAEDVVANVWLRLIANLPKIREPKALRPPSARRARQTPRKTSTSR